MPSGKASASHIRVSNRVWRKSAVIKQGALAERHSRNGGSKNAEYQKAEMADDEVLDFSVVLFFSADHPPGIWREITLSTTIR